MTKQKTWWEESPTWFLVGGELSPKLFFKLHELILQVESKAKEEAYEGLEREISLIMELAYKHDDEEVYDRLKELKSKLTKQDTL